MRKNQNLIILGIVLVIVVIAAIIIYNPNWKSLIINNSTNMTHLNETVMINGQIIKNGGLFLISNKTQLNISVISSNTQSILNFTLSHLISADKYCIGANFQCVGFEPNATQIAISNFTKTIKNLDSGTYQIHIINTPKQHLQPIYFETSNQTSIFNAKFQVYFSLKTFYINPKLFPYNFSNTIQITTRGQQGCGGQCVLLKNETSNYTAFANITSQGACIAGLAELMNKTDYYNQTYVHKYVKLNMSDTESIIRDIELHRAILKLPNSDKNTLLCPSFNVTDIISPV